METSSFFFGEIIFSDINLLYQKKILIILKPKQILDTYYYTIDSFAFLWFCDGQMAARLWRIGNSGNNSVLATLQLWQQYTNCSDL